jgi:NADPH:quinone reductase-like Zn-dependent oxidoreductase
MKTLDFMGKITVVILSFCGLYVVWCWIAVNILGWIVPDGLTFGALVTAGTGLLGMSVIQDSKHFKNAKIQSAKGGETVDNLKKELAKSRKDNEKLSKDMEKIYNTVSKFS